MNCIQQVFLWKLVLSLDNIEGQDVDSKRGIKNLWRTIGKSNETGSNLQEFP